MFIKNLLEMGSLVTLFTCSRRLGKTRGYVNDHISNPSRFPEPYWSNTSSNSIIRDMIENADEAVKSELDILISGRPDIVIYPNNSDDPAYIFEIKNRRKFSEISLGLQEALSQIVDNHYKEGVLEDGYVGVVSYGICFCKKHALLGRLNSMEL